MRQLFGQDAFVDECASQGRAEVIQYSVIQMIRLVPDFASTPFRTLFGHFEISGLTNQNFLKRFANLMYNRHLCNVRFFDRLQFGHYSDS